jgi:hypothetical protein
LAYELWEKRGHPHGAAEEDWFKAEEALKPLWLADLSFSSMESAPEGADKAKMFSK